MLRLYPRVARAIAHHENNHLSAGKITLPQFWALDYLFCNSTATMSELSDFLKITRAATTGLVDRLLSQKLIVRRQDNIDRRLVHISLSPKGRTVIESIRGQKHKRLAQVFSMLSPSDRSEYLRILEQIVKIVNNSTT